MSSGSSNVSKSLKIYFRFKIQSFIDVSIDVRITLIKIDNSVTTAEEMCTQIEKLHVQPELKAYPSQMSNNLKAKKNQVTQLKNENKLALKSKQVKDILLKTQLFSEIYH